MTTRATRCARPTAAACFSLCRRPAATLLLSFVSLVFLVAGLAPRAAAQTALSSGVCDGRIGVPWHYSFNQSGVPYWAVVGVTPEPSDDKDIYLYSGPFQTGSLLASSTGFSGADFVVADFNHTSYGTYYPTVTYGSTTALYVAEWSQGGNILPLNQQVGVPVYAAGSGACFAFNVWDVYLEAGATYRVLSYSTSNPTAILLFRNPGTGAYFAGRSQAVVDIVGDGVYADYTAPANDWYGLVVAQNARVSNSGWADFEVRKLDSCEPLVDGNCVSAVPYDVGSGPADSYSFEQTTNWWTAVAAAPSPGDEKSLRIRSQCDYTALGGPLAESAPAVGETRLLVGDFNHGTPLPTTMFVDVDEGDAYAEYTIEWEDDSDFFYMNSALSGSVGGTSGDCNLVKMWDIFIEAGKTYHASFWRSGTADLRMRLFRNPGSAAYFADEAMAEWKINGTGTITGPASATDWYGLAVYANQRGESGTYDLLFEEVNDCDDIPHMACVESQGNAKDFFMGALTNTYWLAVGVLPSDGDDKDIAVHPTCDGADPPLGVSVELEGADFVVADCNHPPMPASDRSMAPAANNWYPRVTYGSTSAPYTVSCDLGNVPAEDVFPHNFVVEGVVAGTVGDCGMLKIWDVFLFENEQYRFDFTRGGAADVRLALFRNPSSYRMWMGRGSSEWELDRSQGYAYTAPASDYYGLVVFANHRGGGIGNYSIRISSGVTGIEDDAPAPEAYALYQNVPNPFNPTTQIRYDVPPSGGAVQLRIYGVSGRLVRTLVDGVEPAGRRSITWDARDDRGTRVATGVYFYRLDAPGFSETRKMVVVK